MKSLWIAVTILFPAIVLFSCSEPADIDIGFREKFIGGPYHDGGHSIQQTSDGGYIIAGYRTDSPYEHQQVGPADFWLLKTDGEGETEWEKTFGGTEHDVARCVQQTADGGYIMVGAARSDDVGVSGADDIWLIKTDASGAKEWDTTFGAKESDKGHFVRQTTDGGYIVVGTTNSPKFATAGKSDVWLLKTDATGTRQWHKTFGGTGPDEGKGVLQTADGGYIIVGTARSSDLGARGWADVWLIKTDATGVMEWDRVFGGDADDIGEAIQQTADGGYVISGTTWSRKAGAAGRSGAWLIKVDGKGDLEWHRTFFKNDRSSGSSVRQTSDGGYILAGETIYFSPFHEALVISHIILTLLDSSNDSLEPTLEASMKTESWLIRTDSEGNMLWDRVFSGEGFSTANSVCLSAEGDYVVVGVTHRKDHVNAPTANHLRSKIDNLHFLKVPSL